MGLNPLEHDLVLNPEDVVLLTEQICNIRSVSRAEEALADAVELTLQAAPHLEVLRVGNNVLARTTGSASERVVIAGHLDTVPVQDNLPIHYRDAAGDPREVNALSAQDTDVMWGLGTVDMKGGIAMMVHAAMAVDSPAREITWIFYEAEEIASEFNGLGIISASHPQWVRGDFGILCEPTDGVIEGGCQGTVRVKILLQGVAAHSARSWMGENAIHAAAGVLKRLQEYQAREAVLVDGLEYREGLNAVGITGGIAGNVIPPECTVTVNFRFAPDRSLEQAIAHVREVFAGYEVLVDDAAAAARPGLDHPAAQSFAQALGIPARAKYGWTDVARLSQAGIPAVNFGPGDPNLAHAQDERVVVGQLRQCAKTLVSWLEN